MGLWKFFKAASQKPELAEPMTSREANELLVKAVAAGDVKMADQALKSIGSPNLEVDRGDWYGHAYWQARPVPMLWDAVQNGNAPLARLLLQYGAAVDRKYDGMTPLLHAVIEGKTPLVRILLDAGAGLDATHEYRNPLQWAQQKQYGDVTKMLTEEPARRHAARIEAERLRAEAEAQRLVDLETAKQEAFEKAQRAANHIPQTEQIVKVMKPLSLKGAQGSPKKKWSLFS